jgi:hypothetical protein
MYSLFLNTPSPGAGIAFLCAILGSLCLFWFAFHLLGTLAQSEIKKGYWGFFGLCLIFGAGLVIVPIPYLYDYDVQRRVYENIQVMMPLPRYPGLTALFYGGLAYLSAAVVIVAIRLFKKFGQARRAKVVQSIP